MFDSLARQVDELQRQLGGAEDEKKTLNQVSEQFSIFDSNNMTIKKIADQCHHH